MSIEITFHPKRSPRDELKKLLIEHGFKPTKHLWEWPTGSLHFYWLCEEDYRSYAGVEATIFKPYNDDLLSKLGYCAWALHTRTGSWASPSDREHQNKIIRQARAEFGGNFYNDSYGKNRYIKVEADPRDAASRGLYLVYEELIKNIQSVQYALPEPTKDLEKLVGTKLEPLSTVDPVRVLYNALVPFAVAALEHFFSSCFKILLQYNPSAQQRLKEDSNTKVYMSDALSIQAGEMTVEDTVVRRYSFQNINGIHSAFNEWHGIDIWRILRKKRKVGRRLQFLEVLLNDLIDIRHGVVHKFSLNKELRKQDIEEILDLVLVIINSFVDFLEETQGKIIRD